MWFHVAKENECEARYDSLGASPNIARGRAGTCSHAVTDVFWLNRWSKNAHTPAWQSVVFVQPIDQAGSVIDAPSVQLGRPRRPAGVLRNAFQLTTGTRT